MPRYTAKAEAYGDSDRPCVAHVHGLSHASLTIRLSLARCAFARVARHNPTSPLDIYPGLSCHVVEISYTNRCLTAHCEMYLEPNTRTPGVVW